jgi:hypothetical protein
MGGLLSSFCADSKRGSQREATRPALKSQVHPAVHLLPDTLLLSFGFFTSNSRLQAWKEQLFFLPPRKAHTKQASRQQTPQSPAPFHSLQAKHYPPFVLTFPVPSLLPKSQLVHSLHSMPQPTQQLRPLLVFPLIYLPQPWGHNGLSRMQF